MNITLIGFSGVGKTLFGSELAEKLDYVFIDTDELISKSKGLSINELLEKTGEDVFKRIEEQAILDLDLSSDCVIATGGSVIYSTRTMNYSRVHSIIFFLNEPLDSIKERIGGFELRGIVGLSSRTIEEIYTERLPLYQQYADHVIPIRGDYDSSKYVGKILKLVLPKVK